MALLFESSLQLLSLQFYCHIASSGSSTTRLDATTISEFIAFLLNIALRYCLYNLFYNNFFGFFFLQLPIALANNHTLHKISIKYFKMHINAHFCQKANKWLESLPCLIETVLQLCICICECQYMHTCTSVYAN